MEASVILLRLMIVIPMTLYIATSGNYVTDPCIELKMDKRVALNFHGFFVGS
jgi:hypothetical protein